MKINSNSINFQIRSPKTAPKSEASSPKSPQESVSKSQGDLDYYERLELDKWKTRVRRDMGELTTPPAGSIDPKMDAAHAYLTGLLDKVAGKEINESGHDFVLELFTGDVPNAAVEDDMRLERSWGYRHEDREWPVREWVGSPDSNQGKPIYRMIVNVGMLNALETEDELAFILAHQAERFLDHAKLDPNNEDKIEAETKSFIDPRDMQAAADKAAVERIAKAGFNPRAALKALTKLYTLNPIDYPEGDLNRALLAAGHNQEAEGMRVGAVQGEVEDFVRRGDPTVSQEMKPLPDLVKLEARAGYDKPVEDMERFKADFNSLAEKLATDETPAWMFGYSGGSSEKNRIQRAGGDLQDKEEGVLSAVAHLDSLEEKTPHQKVNGLLRMMMDLRRSALPKEHFSAGTMETVSNFLQKYGSEWNATAFTDSLVRGNRDLNWSFTENLVFDRNFQEFSAENLPNLVPAAVKGYLTRQYDEVQPRYIVNLFRRNHDDDRETWPLAKEIDQESLKYLKTVDPTPMLGEIGFSGLSKATEFANDLFGMDEPAQEVRDKIREAGSHIADAAGLSRENRARLKLQLPLQEPATIDRFMEEFGETESWKEFSPEFESDFRKLLSDYITTSAQQPGFFTTPIDETQYSEGLERRVVESLKAADDPEPGLTHLARHLYPTRRIRHHSDRREWLGEAARLLARDGVEGVVKQIASPNRTQYSSTIRDVLTKAYRLTEEDLPDTSTASLKEVQRRAADDEFRPVREDYASDREYYAALRAYNDGEKEIREKLRPISTIESRDVLSRMALLGHDADLSLELTKDMDLDSFLKVFNGAHEALDRYKVTTALYKAESEEDVGADAGAFLMDGFVAVQDQIEGVQQWLDLASRSIDFSDGGLEARVGTKKKLGENLFGRLTGLEETPLRSWLAADKTLEILSAEQSSDLLVECLGEECKPGVAPQDLAKRVDDLEQQYQLIDKFPVAYLEFRDKVAEKAQLQPDTVDTVFPEVVRGVTDTNEVYRKQARSLSGLIAMAREKSPQEQIDTIEYLMGRQDEMPPYLDAASEEQSFAPFRQSLETTRQDLLEADSQTRVMIANSFLAGPSGVLRTEEGKQAVIDHFLKNLKDENRELGEKIANGVLYSHGEADTLAVAYILGQHPEEPEEGQDPGDKGKLDEAAILNRLFDAYGVPGVKMKQYLAFTSEFKDFKEAFESAQDSSMPLNYYQVLKLVQNRFGDEWPKDLKIDRVLGSGSVNVAIRYRNESTGKREVVSLGRQDIEESTKYDFDRFNKLIQYMTQTPEDKEKYGYILGLLDLIGDSVELEFKKDQAMAVQQMAYKTYKHQANGWEVRSIDAYRVENLGLFMEEAKGRTARKIFNKDKDVYNEAMDAMSAAEFGVLRGVDSSGNWRPRPLFANPDFHDGQVMIDEDNKTVTILDFGQAVPITNDDRYGGLDLLTIIGKVDSPKKAAKRLNKRYFPDEDKITKEQLEPIMEREDRMDCFIHLLSMLSREGADVPISSVHWVLGINRQMALAEKIGDPIDKAIRNMLLNHKAGMSLATFNWSYGDGTLETMNDAATNEALKMTGLVGAQMPEQESEPKVEELTFKAWRPNFR